MTIGFIMKKISVWTKQHINVLKELEAAGRYIAKAEYIRMDLQEHAGLVLEAYDWLVRHGPDAANRPADVQYPIWTSFVENATMLPDENSVILELSIDESIITLINIAKWGAILNYSYIPLDEQDAQRHYSLLELYGISDAKACMTQFYPEIKREIVESWDRLFDPNVKLGNELQYGTIWEIKKEWVTEIRR